MTLQSFFLDTYLGDILRTVPLVLLTMGLWYLFRYSFKNGRQVPAKQRLWQTLFAGYIAGLLGLAWFYWLLGELWYGALFNHFHFDFQRPAPEYGFYLEITFFQRFRMENLGNLLMYVPFGVLLPLAFSKATWKKTLLIGFPLIVFVEVCQMFFARTPDVNDVILNTVGLLLSALVMDTIRQKQAKYYDVLVSNADLDIVRRKKLNDSEQHYCKTGQTDSSALPRGDCR